jgi:2-phospho-L-lactate transferase/gluconeogenesis factor (CofD/UPF0052 family)
MEWRTDRARPRIALFCGGRGSASIIRALLDSTDCRLTLPINGFDDGRSTGLVRWLIPGMLGPSDFRKNLATVLDASLPSERALEGLLNLRLGAADQLYGSHGLHGFAVHGDPTRLAPPLASLVNRIEPGVRTQLRAYLRHAVGHLQRAAPHLADADMAIGNLVLAGIFLQMGDFNTALKQFTNLGRTRARIENVCDGVGRWLVALKDDGELLASESEIVAPQSAVPIHKLYLLPQRLDAGTARALAPLSRRAKQAWLAAREVVAWPSEAVLAALAGADLIVFGPGTQHSSLLPSYRIVAEPIRRSPAIAKVLVANLGPDLDDPGGSVSELIHRALRFMGDPENQRRSITHALVDATGPEAGGLNPGQLAGVSRWRGITLIWKDWRDRRRADRHDGVLVARELELLLKQPEVRCGPVQ